MKNLILDEPVKGVARLTLSQPKHRNAINAAMWAALPDLLAELAERGDLRALIITGAGDHFAAGADISEFETLYSTAESATKMSSNIQKSCEALASFPRPTLAMIRGACIGGGCGVALSCDFRFADKTARFAVTPAKLGLVYPFGDIERLIEAVGISHAKDMLFSARMIDAKPAHKIGLIHRVYDAEDLDSKTFDYLAMITARSPESLRVMKTMISAYQKGQRGDTPETDALFRSGFTSKDFAEGYSAFLAKRPPDFSNG